MKTRKYNLNAIAMGVALAMGSVAAAQAAAPVDHPSVALGVVAAQERISSLPTFDISEQTGLAGVESALSIIAAKAHIDHTFCQGATVANPFKYTLAVSAFAGEGTATIDGGAGNGGVTLYINSTSSNEDLQNNDLTLGTRVEVYAKDGSVIKGVTGFSAITDYYGDHHWSVSSYIFNDQADWTFTDAQSGKPIPYGERSIKDYYKRVIDQESWEFDWGLEKVLKYGYPVTKWTELSWYKRPDGGDGYLKVRKDLLKPGGAVCRIAYEASSIVDDGAFSYVGKVRVFRVAP